MNERISKLKEYFMNKEHHIYRKDICIDPIVYREGELHRRSAFRLVSMLNAQDVVFIAGERFAFTRTTKDVPDILSTEEKNEIFSKNYIHELGDVSNICPDYNFLIENGIEKAIADIEESIKVNSHKKEYLASCKMALEAVIEFADRYHLEAKKKNHKDITVALSNIPRKGASSFYEALLFFRLVHFCLWCEGNYHVTIGRFDKYMWSYLEKDLELNILNEESALELLEDFFLSFNKDSDLYKGMQQGDNGQSMVLGGIDENGNDTYNLLSELCLRASADLLVIDPKINLRVNKDTPADRYEFASQLTVKGLGFPQYLNDDVIIAGLVEKGYKYEDAVNYTVAACWEPIIPKKGMDIANIDALSFLACADTAFREQPVDFARYMKLISIEIEDAINGIVQGHKNLFIRPSVLMSTMMDGCIEKGEDISKGCLYNNYGIHGTGVANAANYIMAVKKIVYEGCTSIDELISAMDENYVGYEELYNQIKYQIPKMGDDNDEVDEIATKLLDCFADECDNHKNQHGGCYRAGTGTAMYYVNHAKDMRATADGRKSGELLPANYSPALSSKLKGPFSVIKSFTKPNLVRVINGGPLTLEFASSDMPNQSSKLGMLVKNYIDLGGHQIQLNVINSKQLLEANKNPEQYKNLVVRVWGWSGYFVELDEVYRNHILSRYGIEL